MQKKIMLALIISSSGVINAQEGSAGAGSTAMPPIVEVERPVPSLAEASAAMAESTIPVQTMAAELSTQTPSAALSTVEVAPLPAETIELVESTPQQPLVAPVPSQQAPMISVEAPAFSKTPADNVRAPGAMPPMQIVEPQQFEQSDMEIKGIDTVNVNEAKGNWLYKRIWWEKAEDRYAKIKQLTDKLIDVRMDFFLKRNGIDRMLFEFYSDVGFRQGEFADITNYLTRQLEQERKAEGALDEKELEILNTLTQEKKNIEQMQLGIQTLGKIDKALEDALLKLTEQLHQAKYYEQQSWEIFKAINREISDKKARELFYTMDTYWRNLNSINAYLSDAFSTYFEQLIQKLTQESDKIKTSVQALSEKGISLQAQSLAMRKECKMPAQDEEQEQETEQTTGFLGGAWKIIMAPFNAIGSVFGGMYNWVAGLFGGSADEVMLAKPARRASE